MKIEQFIEKQKELIDNYHKAYLKDHAESPEEFPLEMEGLGEWLSDYSCWLEIAGIDV